MPCGTRLAGCFQELADLRLTIQNTGSQILRSRLESDFEQKLSELIRRDPRQEQYIRQQIRLRLKGLQRQSEKSVDSQVKKREVQKTAHLKLEDRLRVQITTPVPSKRLQNWGTEDLRALPSGVGNSETGVMWSQDERYVALRYEVVKGRSQPTKTEIFDLQTGALVPHQTQNGLMASFGHLWGTQSNEQVEVRNFITGEKFGPFAVTRSLMSEDITPNYFITRGQTNDTVYTYSKGPLEIGHYYGMSTSSGRVAFLDQGRLRIVDMATGLDLSTPQGVGNDLRRLSESTHGTKGYLIFADGDKPKILFLDDLSVHSLKDYGDSAATVEVLAFVGKNHPHVSFQYHADRYWLTNHDNGLEISFAGFPRPAIDGKVVSYDAARDIWVLIDPATMSQQDIPGTYQEVIADRYLRSKTPNGSRSRYSFYDLKTGTEVSFNFNGKIDPVPGSDLFIFQEAGGKTWLGLLDAGYFPQNQLKEGEIAGHESIAGFSPSGKHFIAERDGKIVILKDQSP